jgi:hypothetical protein
LLPNRKDPFRYHQRLMTGAETNLLAIPPDDFSL